MHANPYSMRPKICALNFKISGSDFEIRATNFFLSPGRGKALTFINL